MQENKNGRTTTRATLVDEYEVVEAEGDVSEQVSVLIVVAYTLSIHGISFHCAHLYVHRNLAPSMEWLH